VVHTQYGSRRPVLALARELNHVFLNLLDNAVRARLVEYLDRARRLRRAGFN